MTNRIIELSDTGAYVHLTNSLIEIRIHEGEKHTIPVEEVGVLLLSNPAITITQSAIVAIIQSGGMVVLCDNRYLPAGMFLPVGVHTTAAKNYDTQINASLPLKKHIWKEIVRKKILFQSELLFNKLKQDGGLKQMAGLVQSGDPENIEGQSSRIYWKILFGKEFKRDRDACDHNRFLNYGYTILRACTARAICSSGLHPSFGIHHHNQYDAFRLADDLMEPFRPMVDKKVFELLNEKSPFEEVDKDTKRRILEILTGSVRMKKENISIFDALTKLTVSVFNIFEKKRKDVVLPESLIV
ncbi:MAG: type II CRISPR-associated endonuclease Cas1 [Brevinematales bacterium]|nr:type II CRISPR-associated endonuclease Cas1 [Brevinematales bacterium]